MEGPIHPDIGTTAKLDAIQAMHLLWGLNVDVFNFFSKTNMQPSAVVYAANCSILAGESVGWKRTLQHLENRSLEGFNYGQLMLGFPGRNALAHMMKTEYGPRWLGVLAVASLINKEHSGSREVYHLLRAVADENTRSFVLNMEQAEQMWTMGREIFFGSPVHRRFLYIMDQCASLYSADFLSHAYPGEDTDFLTVLMTAAMELWQIASIRLGKKIYAQGSTGVIHLILYLTVVCGFHVTTRFDDQKVQFGDEVSSIKVELVFDRDQKEWKTGFEKDSLSLKPSVQKWPHGDNNSTVWRPDSAATFIPPNLSTYALGKDDRDMQPSGTVNLADLAALRHRILGTANQCAISYWLANYLHLILISTKLATNSFTQRGAFRRSIIRADIIERIMGAIQLYGSGLILDDEIISILDRIRKRQPPNQLGALSDHLVENEAKLLCTSCPSATRESGFHPCDVTRIQWELEELAWKIWICSHTQIECQRILRDAGPNRDWQVMDRLGMLPGYMNAPEFIETAALLNCVAERLTGRLFSTQREKLLAISAGGAVIGLNCNETQEVHLDSGHCLYIILGSMETRERRVKEVCEDDVPSRGFGGWESSVKLSSITRPQDGFGDCSFNHSIQLQGETAVVSTTINVGEKVIGVGILDAIDNCPFLSTFQGCLSECAAGKLRQEEVDQVRVVSGSNYGSLVDVVGSGRAPPRLDLVLAHKNVPVQRMVVSYLESWPCLVHLGSCVHCAVRTALRQGAKVLIDGSSTPLLKHKA